MALTRQEKVAVIEELTARLANAQSVVAAQYRGLSVESMTKLRKNARQKGVYLRVLKNTLAKRCINDSSFAELSPKMVGPLIYAISDDPVSAAKVLVDFSKENDKFIVTAGAMPGQLLDENGVKALATMPSREELLAKLMGTMQAPITQFVRTLNEIPTKFVRGLAAVRDQKESQSA
ncbi:MAG: 50S ribosomal protein L10 [Limnobacter sp.]|nr:50S ribosomal protein L10 [Limnobacter sp.]